MKRAIAEGRCVPPPPVTPPYRDSPGQGRAERGGHIPRCGANSELPCLQLSSSERPGPTVGGARPEPTGWGSASLWARERWRGERRLRPGWMGVTRLRAEAPPALSTPASVRPGSPRSWGRQSVKEVGPGEKAASSALKAASHRGAARAAGGGGRNGGA